MNCQAPLTPGDDGDAQRHADHDGNAMFWGIWMAVAVLTLIAFGCFAVSRFL